MDYDYIMTEKVTMYIANNEKWMRNLKKLHTYDWPRKIDNVITAACRELKVPVGTINTRKVYCELLKKLKEAA